MVELWLVISTMCWNPLIGAFESEFLIQQWAENACLQAVSISTSKVTPTNSETVYKVMPDGHVALPSKVWGEVLHQYYWGKPQILKDQAFESILNKVSNPCKHRWVSEYVFLRYFNKDNFDFYAHTKENHMTWDEYCVDCKKRRRKYTEEKWEVEE